MVRFTRLDGASSPEAYRLHVTKDTLLISAASADGFRFAWQTVKQLKQKNAVMACDVVDAPAFKWRSLMLDVSRHFQPISFLKKQIDVMAQYKFNRLHLHLTDAAGWRVEIKRYPRLTELAAWREGKTWKEWSKLGCKYMHEGEAGAYGGYYTQDELRDLVSYAAERGITIVPEIEMPGHSAEVLTAYPELSCTHEPYKQMDFCPGSVATYDFLENVLKEVMDIFPSKYIHVGGDEADKASWPSCPLCQQKMKELGTDKDGPQAHHRPLRQVPHRTRTTARRLGRSDCRQPRPEHHRNGLARSRKGAGGHRPRLRRSALAERLLVSRLLSGRSRHSA